MSEKNISLDNLAKFKAKADEAYAAAGDLSAKQDALVSGTNIKTVNGNSLLGSGNIDVAPEAMTTAEVLELFNDLKKGRIVTFDAFGDGIQHSYRILSGTGKTVKLLDLDYNVKGKYDSNGSKHAFENGEAYAAYLWGAAPSSSCDSAMKAYSNALAADVRNAIQPIPVLVQSAYQISTTAYATDESIFVQNGSNTLAFTRISQHT